MVLIMARSASCTTFGKREKARAGFTTSLLFSTNQRVGRQTEKAARSAAEQLGLVEELKSVATRLGFEVREEKLLREVGYRVRSGSCRVREAHVILLDRGLPPSAQIDILVEELAGRPLDDVYLSPVARRLLERAVPSPATPEPPVS
jgi:hypothetical protein